MAPPLLALDAEAVIAGPSGQRRVPMASFFLGVRRTVLAPDELLVEIVVPAAGRPQRRQLPAAHAAARARHRGRGRRVAAHAGRRPAAPRPASRSPPWRPCRSAPPRPSRSLEGQPVTPAADRARGRRSRSAAARPIDDQRGSVEFRQHLVRVLTRRTLTHRARQRARAPDPRRNSHVAKQVLSCTVNDEAVEVLVQPYETLLDALREDLGLTGPKEGCGTGDCGACTVHLDGKPVASCLMLAMQARGRTVRTIEGLGGSGRTLHPLQDAFVRHGRAPVRLLHPGRADGGRGAPRREPAPHRGGDPLRHRRQSLPLHRLHEDGGRDRRGGGRRTRSQRDDARWRSMKTTRDVKGVGLSIPRPDGPEKVTGHVQYVADIKPRACCTPSSCAARTPTPRSSASTRARPRPCPACAPCSPPPTSRSSRRRPRRAPTRCSPSTAWSSWASRWPRWPRTSSPSPRRRSTSSRSSTRCCPPSIDPLKSMQPGRAAGGRRGHRGRHQRGARPLRRWPSPRATRRRRRPSTSPSRRGCSAATWPRASPSPTSSSRRPTACRWCTRATSSRTPSWPSGTARAPHALGEHAGLVQHALRGGRRARASRRTASRSSRWSAAAASAARSARSASRSPRCSRAPPSGRCATS